MALKVIVIGYGHLGRWHVDKAMALKEAELVAVVDPDPETPAKLKEKNIDVPVFKDLKECQLEYQAAFVVTPTSLHFKVCLELLEMGKHIFCEKPMTQTYEEALELEKLAEEKKVVFQVGHSERFHEVWQTVKEKEQFFQGQPIFHLKRLAPFKGRATDVDVVQDLMIHDLDLLLFLLDDVPQKIEAVGKKIRTDKWDFAEAYLEYSCGTRAVITVGRNHIKEIREFEIINNAGTLNVDLFEKKIHIAEGKETKEFVKSAEYPGRDHLLEEHKNFYQAIEKGTDPVVTCEDGRLAVYLVEKVLMAIESGKSESC